MRINTVKKAGITLLGMFVLVSVLVVVMNSNQPDNVGLGRIIRSNKVSLSSYEQQTNAPKIVNLQTYPQKVRPGDVLLIEVQAKDDVGISSVTAEMPYEGGTDTIKFVLIGGTINHGIYEGRWIVHDTLEKWYNSSVKVMNINDETSFATVMWFDPTVSHPASQVTEGTFNDGNYTFVENLTVIGAFEHGCPNTTTNQMVKVGDFCIDKYESYVVSGALGNSNGNDTTAVAGSKPGVDPQASITWFQAAQACANAGKRLCTNAEWQIAVSGTPDPGADGGSTGCNVNSNNGSGDYADASGTPANTGAHSACKSRWEVYDMVGNVWEWTADWAMHPGWNGDLSSMTAEYGSDGYWHGGPNDANNPTRGADGSWRPYAPAMTGNGDTAGEETSFAAAIRGGYWLNGASAGSFALHLTHAPSYSTTDLGFRCCS